MRSEQGTRTTLASVALLALALTACDQGSTPKTETAPAASPPAPASSEAPKPAETSTAPTETAPAAPAPEAAPAAPQSEAEPAAPPAEGSAEAPASEPGMAQQVGRQIDQAVGASGSGTEMGTAEGVGQKVDEAVGQAVEQVQSAGSSVQEQATEAVKPSE